MSSIRLFFLVFVYMLTINLNGCAVMQSISHKDELASYAESVFRRQNSITSSIMMMTDDELPEDSELDQAEIAMHEACRLLNEYSIREMEGKPMGVLFRRKVKASIKGCDESIQTLEEVLGDL